MITAGPWKGQTFAGLSVAYDPITDQTIVAKDRDRDLVIFELKLHQ